MGEVAGSNPVTPILLIITAAEGLEFAGKITDYISSAIIGLEIKKAFSVNEILLFFI